MWSHDHSKKWISGDLTNFGVELNDLPWEQGQPNGHGLQVDYSNKNKASLESWFPLFLSALCQWSCTKWYPHPLGSILWASVLLCMQVANNKSVHFEGFAILMFGVFFCIRYKLSILGKYYWIRTIYFSGLTRCVTLSFFFEEIDQYFWFSSRGSMVKVVSDTIKQLRFGSWLPNLIPVWPLFNHLISFLWVFITGNLMSRLSRAKTHKLLHHWNFLEWAILVCCTFASIVE